MFEEKVQRENFRKIEKEKERIDRAAEIQKIKDTYNREIKQLKDKYEKSRYLKILITYTSRCTCQHIITCQNQGIVENTCILAIARDNIPTKIMLPMLKLHTHYGFLQLFLK